MIDLRRKDNARRTKGIITRKLDIYIEDASGKGRVRRTKDDSFPIEDIRIVDWAGRTICGWIAPKVSEFTGYAFRSCHFLDAFKIRATSSIFTHVAAVRMNAR
jgi:hypothetical protein